jgi:hypothetical protein
LGFRLTAGRRDSVYISTRRLKQRAKTGVTCLSSPPKKNARDRTQSVPSDLLGAVAELVFYEEVELAAVAIDDLPPPSDRADYYLYSVTPSASPPLVSSQRS